MLELGTVAPDFLLPDFGANGKSVSKKDFRKATGLLVIFMCNHCPYVHHVRKALADFAKEYQPKGLAIVGINANDVASYPDDSPDKMAEEVANFGYPFPYLFDETQAVAKAYRAACTPDFFLFDKARKLVYRGQFDDSRPKNGLPVTGQDLRAATDALLSGQTIDQNQKASLGCNIKWREGNEPDYFRSIKLKPSLAETLGPQDGLYPKGFSGWGPRIIEPEEIGEYVRNHFNDWLDEKGLTKPLAIPEMALQERMDRVEEELGQQRESMKQGFDLMEKRFDQADKRFGQVERHLQKIDKRCDQMEKRFEVIEKRFEAGDKRFDLLNERTNRFMTRSLGIGIGIVVVLVIALMVL